MLAGAIPVHEPVDRDAHHAARLGDGSDRLVELVAHAVVDGLRVRMREEHRLLRFARVLEGGRIPAMRKIDTHPDVVQLGDQLAAEARETAAAFLETTIAREAGL